VQLADPRMTRIFKIFDTRHYVYISGSFSSYAYAIAELEYLASIPWDSEPNCAPCKSWRTCGRKYLIDELNPVDTKLPGLGKTPVLLEISAAGVVWSEIPDDVTPD
jgi:hypothetical protein